MLSDASRRLLAGLLEARTGQQLCPTRGWRIETALAPLLRARGLASIDQLAVRLGSDADLADAAVDAMLNNETYFFRDRKAFELLRVGPLRRLAAARTAEKRLSLWCAGCSTGQEAWSLAMLFAEDALRWAGWTIDIAATDVSRAAIERGRRGVYSQFEVQRGLAVREMLRWFEPAGTGDWRIGEALRGRVRFETRSLCDLPPAPGRFDVILCRNLLLYFGAERRRAAFERLGDAIAPDGTLMLGAGETVIGQTGRFVSDAEHRGLYVPATPSAAAAGRPRRACGG